MPLALEITVLLLLIAANGFFAMVEFAVVSARKSRLRQLAEQGDAGARAALKMAEDPNRFLSTVQIGITLIGILAGAFAGTTLAVYLQTWLLEIPALAPYAGPVALGSVVIAITFLTLVFGELVPKRLGLNSPEKIAAAFSRPMQALARAASPVVWVLSGATDLALRILRVPPAGVSPITEEEIAMVLEEGRRAGIVEAAEQDMVKGVFRFGDRRLTALMTPRVEMVALDLEAPPEENWQKIIASGHTWYPVYRSPEDAIIGVITVRDLWAQVMSGKTPDLASILQEPLYIPERRPALGVLEHFRTSTVHIALATDEYGRVTGILTLHDIIEAIVGDLPSHGEEPEPEILQREDGSWLVDGLLPVQDIRDRLGLGPFPGEEEGDFDTLAGFVVSSLGHIPATGEHVTWEGYRFEVMDMDGRRVDKVLVVPPAKQDGGEGSG
ncbi:MAG: hemolysin family protein [Methanomicrobiales archaeon]|nr:hemolysin family protein [Methanomicrobiales archaeon]